MAIYFDGSLGAAIETAHSASVNAARVERQIAQLYGLIAEAEESSLGLTLPIEVADPQLNQLESGRFAGVVDQRVKSFGQAPQRCYSARSG